MEDKSKQIREMCRLWWNTRDVKKEQEMFKEKDCYPEECWTWQLQQFLNSTFEYTDNTTNQKKSFIIKDLEESIKIRLIRQLGIELGFFLRDFEKIYYEKFNNKP